MMIDEGNLKALKAVTPTGFDFGAALHPKTKVPALHALVQNNSPYPDAADTIGACRPKRESSAGWCPTTRSTTSPSSTARLRSPTSPCTTRLTARPSWTSLPVEGSNPGLAGERRRRSTCFSRVRRAPVPGQPDAAGEAAPPRVGGRGARGGARRGHRRSHVGGARRERQDEGRAGRAERLRGRAHVDAPGRDGQGGQGAGGAPRVGAASHEGAAATLPDLPLAPARHRAGEATSLDLP